MELKSKGNAKIAGNEHPVFGYIMKGSAKVTLRKDSLARTNKVKSGELFYVPEHTHCEIENEEARTFHAVWIQFIWEIAPIAKDAADENTPEEAEEDVYPFELYSFRVPQARGWIGEFVEDVGELEPARYYKLQSYLYTFASVFATRVQMPKIAADERLSNYVEQTKRYIQEHYGDPLDVEDIARQSGVSPGKFYEQFRKHTGLSPHKYITAIRLNMSLALLAHSRSSIAEVAHTIGYADELYFSRLFKKHMGMSPSEYAVCASRRIVMPPIFVGDLSVLGISPEWVLDRSWHDNPAPYVQKIAETKPELVLASPMPDELFQSLNEIAPVVSLHWKTFSWKKRLLQISEMLGISSVAAWWLAYYDHKVDNARQHVLRLLGDTPFLLASSFGSRFRVYGMQMNKVKDLFYDDLQVKQPAAAHRFGLLEVDTLAEIAELDCDHLLLLMPVALSDEAIAALEKEWHSLKSNRSQVRCFIIRYEQPLMYNASMYESLIDQTVNLLLQKDG